MSAEEEIRMACVDRAIVVHEKFETGGSGVLETARRIFDFVSGKNDAAIIMDAQKLAELVCKTGNAETLDAARDLAEKCRKSVPRINALGVSE